VPYCRVSQRGKVRIPQQEIENSLPAIVFSPEKSGSGRRLSGGLGIVLAFWRLSPLFIDEDGLGRKGLENILF
jgi:hypothetical protein